MSHTESGEGSASLEEWMPAIAARSLIIERNGPMTPVATAIATRAHVGLLRAKAMLFRFEVRGDRGAKKWEERRDAEIPRAFWWAEGQAALEQNWSIGDFSTWIDKTYEMQAFGVHFERKGIEAMLVTPAAGTGQSPAPASITPAERGGDCKVATKGRNLSHNHPFAAAMVALKLAEIPPNERSRLNPESVGRELEEFYRESHEENAAPHPDNLKDFGKSVLDALKRRWDGNL